MLEGKEVYRTIEITDNVKTASLSVMEQIRLLASSMANDDYAELDTNEKLSAENLRRSAALSIFLQKTIDKMTELKKTSATIGLASDFLPYLDEIIDSDTGLGRYYDFKVQKRNLPMSIRHKVIVKISVK